MRPSIVVHTQAQTAESLVIGDKPPVLKVMVFLDELESVMEAAEKYAAEEKNNTHGCCICFKTGALLRILESFGEVEQLMFEASPPTPKLDLSKLTPTGN